MPTVAPDLGYDLLADVKSGLEAQAGYLEAIPPETTQERREALQAALLNYRGRDTKAMMVAMERLSRQLEDRLVSTPASEAV